MHCAVNFLTYDFIFFDFVQQGGQDEIEVLLLILQEVRYDTRSHDVIVFDVLANRLELGLSSFNIIWLCIILSERVPEVGENLVKPY